MPVSETLKAILGESYKEDMTSDEILEALNKNPNIADISSGNYVSAQKHNDAMAKARKKEQELKDKLSSNEQALKDKMTDDEKAEQSIKEQEALLANQAEEIRKLKVSTICANAGLKEEQYKGIVDSGASADIATAFVNTLTAQTQELSDRIKELELDGFISPNGGTGNKDVPLSEMTLDEQVTLKRTNPKEYERRKKL